MSVALSTGFWCLTSDLSRLGDVAQLGEHRLCKPGVEGSIPFVSTLDSGAFLAKESKKWPEWLDE